MLEANTITEMPGITRVEVIDENGRSYVKYLDEVQKVQYSVQDDYRTLKVFISTKEKE